MKRDSVNRACRRVRTVFAAILGLIVLLALNDYIRSSAGNPLYVRLTRALGYDGCLCQDCDARFSPLGGGWQPAPCGLAGWARHRAEINARIAFGIGIGASTAGVFVGPVIVRRRAKRAAARAGRACSSCGYDVRGLASDRCPECGTPTSTQQQS